MTTKRALVGTAVLASAAFLSACGIRDANDEKLSPIIHLEIAAHLKTHNLSVSSLAPYYTIPVMAGKDSLGVARFDVLAEPEGCAKFDIMIHRDRYAAVSKYTFCPAP